MSKWVSVWGHAMSRTEQNASGYAKDITLSYPIMMPLDGNEVRLTFDNFTGLEDVKIDQVTVSKLVDSTIIDETTLFDVTFNGEDECILKKGQEVTSDSIKMDVHKGDVLCVRMYFGDFTSLYCGVQMFGLTGKGYFSIENETHSIKLPSVSTKEIGWMYYLSRVDVLTKDEARSIICYGDSISALTWPDYLQASLMKDNKEVAIVRKAVSGSRVLREYDALGYVHYGIKGTTRFPHEIDVYGADTVVILQGINDIIHPVGVEVNEFRPWSDLPTPEDLIEGYRFFIKEARNKNLKVYIGTLTPIKGWRTYEPFRNDIREQVNTWIRTTDEIDGYIDFDKVIKDENDPTLIKPIYDSGDHLHPNDAGMKEMAKEAYKFI